MMLRHGLTKKASWRQGSLEQLLLETFGHALNSQQGSRIVV